MWPISECKRVWYYEYGLTHVVALNGRELSQIWLTYSMEALPLAWEVFGSNHHFQRWKLILANLILSVMRNLFFCNLTLHNQSLNTSSDFTWLLPNHKFSPTCRYFCINAFSFSVLFSPEICQQRNTCMYAYLYITMSCFFCLPIFCKIMDHTDPSFRAAVHK